MIKHDEKPVRVGGSTLAISGDMNHDWFIGYSPHYDALAAEGPWEEWVRLAQAILAENTKRQTITRKSQR